jgi:hypothetical protein
MRKNVYLVLLLVSLFALAIGAASPATNAAAQSSQNQTSTCAHASTFLVGRLAELPRIKNLIHDTCDFRVQMNEIPSSVSRFDRLFIESAIAGNMLEIQSLQYTLERTTNEEYRGLLQMMIAMHMSDLEMALEIAEKIGADKTPNLNNARVYPQTPGYDLGMRRINLVARFLDPLMSGPDGSTVTPVPTTGTGTLPPPMTPTAMGTVTFVAPPTGTPTPFATETGTGVPTGTMTETAPAGSPTVGVTGTSTAIPTGTGTEASTGTATTVPAGTGTAIATGTGTALPTNTQTAIATGSATMTSTETGTAVPTVVAPNRPDFEMLSMHIIEDEHVMSIETALVAQRLAKNHEIRAFAKHAADVAKLHVLLLDDLSYRLAFNITLPEPRFHEDYQSPRRLEPASDDGDD